MWGELCVSTSSTSSSATTSPRVPTWYFEVWNEPDIVIGMERRPSTSSSTTIRLRACGRRCPARLWAGRRALARPAPRQAHFWRAFSTLPARQECVLTASRSRWTLSRSIPRAARGMFLPGRANPATSVWDSGTRLQRGGKLAPARWLCVGEVPQSADYFVERPIPRAALPACLPRRTRTMRTAMDGYARRCKTRPQCAA